MQRRKFLRYFSSAAGASTIGLSSHSWFAQTEAIAASSSRNSRFIVILLRGAVDGLSLLVPYRENAYYEVRPTIAIPPPGQPNGAIALNGQFGLHPQLKLLLPFWQQKQLAIALNCGLPKVNRSHFEAQDAVEIAAEKRLKNGWMNRLLGVLAGSANPIQAVNVGNKTPRILVGEQAIASLASGKAAEHKLSLDQANIAQAFDSLYDRSDQLGQTYQAARAAREALQKAVTAEAMEAMEADNGAPLPKGFARDAQRLAHIMRRDARVQLGFFELGGWDTHINQGASQGQLGRKLRQLGAGLVALKAGLGPAFNQTTIVVMSEFGRTLKENGNGGTDHGWGNAMLLLGGGLPGGKFYGDWQGLERSQLNENRDLPVTTDFRDVLSQALEKRLGLDEAQLAQVFPEHSRQSRLW